MPLTQMFPAGHKETVTIVRGSAYEHGVETEIASDVIAMIRPVSSTAVQRDTTRLREGVPTEQSYRIALLSEPNLDIAKGDFLVQSDDTRFRIIDILHTKGFRVMRLYLVEYGVV